MTQKVHFIDGNRYSQAPLVYDYATGKAWLRDNNGQIIPPSPDLTIHTGPVAIRKKPIYWAAKSAGYRIEVP